MDHHGGVLLRDRGSRGCRVVPATPPAPGPDRAPRPGTAGAPGPARTGARPARGGSTAGIQRGNTGKPPGPMPGPRADLGRGHDAVSVTSLSDQLRGGSARVDRKSAAPSLSLSHTQKHVEISMIVHVPMKSHMPGGGVVVNCVDALGPRRAHARGAPWAPGGRSSGPGATQPVLQPGTGLTHPPRRCGRDITD